jgi:ABC-type phosphonate transport system ATPase subunit
MMSGRSRASEKGVLARESCLVDEPDRSRHGVEHPQAFDVTVEQARQLRIRGERLENLDEREIGDPFAVGQAASAQNDRVLVLGQKLVHEPRLADSGGAEQREQMARLVSDRPRVGLP